MDLGQQRTRKVVNDLEHLLYKERLIELGVFILEKKNALEDLLHVYKYPMGRNEEEAARVSRLRVGKKLGGVTAGTADQN